MPTSSKDESREKMTLRKPHPLGWGAVMCAEIYFTCKVYVFQFMTIQRSGFPQLNLSINQTFLLANTSETWYILR